MSETLIDDKSDKIKGKPITCQLCGYKFSMIDPEKRKEWHESNFTCPSCGEDYVMLPETERVLRKIQDKYFAEGRDDKYLSEMYVILISYSKSMLKKHFSNRLHDFEGALDYYAHTSAQLLVMRYKQKDDFIITVSFGQFLIKKIYEAVFGKMEHSFFGEVNIGKDKKGNMLKGTVDTLNYEFKDGSIVEYEDTKKSVIDNIEETEDKRNLCIFLCQLIYNVREKCYSKGENYARLMAVDSHLTKNSSYADKLFEVYGNEGRETYSATMDLVKECLIKDSQISTVDTTIKEREPKTKHPMLFLNLKDIDNDYFD